MTPYEMGKMAAGLKPLPTSSPMDFRQGDHAKGLAGAPGAFQSFQKAIGLGASPGAGPKPPTAGAPRSAPNPTPPPSPAPQASPYNQAKSWLGSPSTQQAANSTGSRSMLPRSLTTWATKRLAPSLGRVGAKGATGLATKATGPLATPINAAMEGVDALGGLPEWAGGSGIGSFGWAPNHDFRRETSIGRPGENLFGYSGPGWQVPNYLGASLNSWSKPTRAAGNLVAGAGEAIGRPLYELYRGHRLNNQ